ncbi:EAL and HDOD domain-containing protein [Cryptosporangium phraense]|uniref:HDOD domain-containing protein n=1 Tax=Cryptosporangium phraense TaxID=2593070 RepID=A0A545AL01_9ACTN|nr:HDOD domain-containing protein [Cryptosporangium phraense]TQS41997.1 HDOD domain-containing protein [Cryptosporangium phraense]
MLKQFPDGSTPPLIHVGRQPIYNRGGDVVAYQLVFRDTAGDGIDSRARTDALTQLIVAAFTEFGVEELVGEAACFVTVNRDFLTGAVPVPFDPGHTGLSVSAAVTVDDEVADGAAELARRGFTFALDPGCGLGTQERLLPYAGYVTIDLRGAAREEIEAARHALGPYPHVHAIAGHLQAEDDLLTAIELGFELFTGPAVGRAHVVSRPRLSTTATARLRLIALLSAEDAGVDEVTSAVAQDPAVSYRLLAAAGAAASGQTREVAGLREAVVLLGFNRIQGWVTLMLISDGDALDEHVASVVLSRARFCSQLAPVFGAPPDAAFTVGLLDGLSDQLGLPIPELVGSLPLAPPLKAALTSGAGPLGQVLRIATRYADGVVERLPGVLGPAELADAQFTALRWAHLLLASA